MLSHRAFGVRASVAGVAEHKDVSRQGVEDLGAQLL